MFHSTLFLSFLFLADTEYNGYGVPLSPFGRRTLPSTTSGPNKQVGPDLDDDSTPHPILYHHLTHTRILTSLDTTFALQRSQRRQPAGFGHVEVSKLSP